MKSSLLLPCAAILALSSCAQIATSLQQPLTSDYNPLDGPNAPSTRKNFQPTGPSYKPGEWVETTMPNSPFFYKIPRGNASADQILSKSSPLKVISTKNSYLKVELEGGSVGYVPAIMVAHPTSPSASAAPFLPPPPSEPLQRSNNDFLAPASLPETPSGSSSSSSVIPPPSGFSSGGSSSPDLTLPDRGATEVLIPTAPPTTLPDSSGGSIPVPSGQIDQTIGIE